MTRTLKLTSILIGISFLAVAFALLAQTPFKASGSAASFATVYMTKGGGSYSAANATTTATTTESVTYLAAGATTTFPFYAEHADLVTLDIRMTASTSAGYLTLTYETSNDLGSCATDPNSCNWSNPAIITSGVAASTTPVYTWRPDGALNATSSLAFTINPVGSKFIRVKANSTGSAVALWISASNKIQLP